ncbi:MAG: hypothetical protein JW969_12315 [Spirochaetales bacterium]|nr:hypothetical protein [Spirochaetales bacterium]
MKKWVVGFICGMFSVFLLLTCSLDTQQYTGQELVLDQQIDSVTRGSDPELINNGGFESGVTGWSFAEGDFHVAAYYSAKFGVLRGALRQYLGNKLQAGKHYYLNFRAGSEEEQILTVKIQTNINGKIPVWDSGPITIPAKAPGINPWSVMQTIELDIVPSEIGDKTRLLIYTDKNHSEDSLRIDFISLKNAPIPAYDPGYWNNDPDVKKNNNCYNYACNKRTDGFAQPGVGSGQMFTGNTIAAIKRAAINDGLIYAGLNMPSSIPPGKALVGLIVGQVWYHWYRKDRDTPYWSHKPGQENARNWDAHGVRITNPKTCEWEPERIVVPSGNFSYLDNTFMNWGGFFYVDSSYTQGQGEIDIKP